MAFLLRYRAMTVAVVAGALCACAGPGAPGRTSLEAVAIGEPPPAPPVRGDAARDGAGRSRPDSVPTAAEIFDFHPPGSRPGSWREPFVVSYSEGPLNGYRLKTLAELQELRDHRYDLASPSPSAPR